MKEVALCHTLAAAMYRIIEVQPFGLNILASASSLSAIRLELVIVLASGYC